MSDNNQEVFNSVLAITRDQLSKSMSLATELEALLVIERKKTAELEDKIAELESKISEEKKN
jgi:BMFP domain-containing protein YqiC